MLAALVMGAAQAQSSAPAAPTAADLYSQAQEYAVQADIAYPQAFYDRTLWKASVDSAYAAATLEPSNRAYQAYLAQLYTKTQWWANAYNAWLELGELSATERRWASLTAAKLAYLALERGDRVAAQAYVQRGLAWADSASLRALQSRLY